MMSKVIKVSVWVLALLALGSTIHFSAFSHPWESNITITSLAWKYTAMHHTNDRMPGNRSADIYVRNLSPVTEVNAGNKHHRACS